jgi:hypothetical protein
MTVFESLKRLEWGTLDLPLLGLTRDWDGQTVDPPAGFTLALDRWYLWFIATRRCPADLHPKSRPGGFLPELWKHDVAELFIGTPTGRRYFEFNLSPNGAWWSCEFTAPRQRAEEVEIAMPEVATFAELGVDGTWVAAMALPLDLLRARLDFGPGSPMNVAFILESPQQRFLSAADLGGGAPDFHRPDRFSKAAFTSPPAI